MARPVCVVASGGAPFVSVSDGPPATPVADGPPITLVESGAPPICLVNDDGSAWFENVADADYGWDFIADQAIWNGASIGALANTPNWTFTRASTAYYRNAAGVLIPFGSGVLRTGDRGALIEGAGTNLCLQSQDFATTWARLRINAFGSGSVVNATTAPDGTSTADFICEDTNNDTHFVRQAVTVSSGVAHTFSVYAKAGTRSIVTVGESATTLRTATFDLSAGTVSNVGSSITATITALADGWYRCAITYTTASTTFNADIGIRTTSGAGFQTYTGDGASGLYLWGAQLEATAYASSYIPTTTASATRAADSLTVTGVSGLDYPLTLYAAVEPTVNTGVAQHALVFDNGSSANRSRISLNGVGGALALSTAASSTQASITAGSGLSVGAVHKIAARFATNDVQIAVNATFGVNDTVATNPTGCSIIRFGVDHNPSGHLYGYLRRLAIFSRGLSDAELTALTT